MATYRDFILNSDVCKKEIKYRHCAFMLLFVTLFVSYDSAEALERIYWTEAYPEVKFSDPYIDACNYWASKTEGWCSNVPVVYDTLRSSCASRFYRPDISWYYTCDKGGIYITTYLHFEDVKYYVSLDDVEESPANHKELGKACPSEGDPINPAGGNVFEEIEDYSDIRHHRLVFSRFYNSLSTYSGNLGQNWQHSFETHIQPASATQSEYIGISANQSNLYTSKSSACTEGWKDVRENALDPNMKLSTAEYRADGTCSVSLNGVFIKNVDVYSNGISSGSESTPAWKLVREDGKAFTFHETSTGLEGDANAPGKLVKTDTGFAYLGLNDEKEYFDESGKLLSIIFRDGHRRTFVYDADRLIRVEDSDGRSISFTYNDVGLINSLITPENRKIGYQYDASGRLEIVKQTDGSTTNYLYNENDKLIALVDENGSHYASWTYDGQGRATSSQRVGGIEKTTLDYIDDMTTVVTEVTGAVRTYHFAVVENERRPISITQKTCDACPSHETLIEYDANGYQASKTDWNGIRTTYTRDELGRELSRTEAAGTSEARTITTEWHPSLSLPVRITEPGKLTLMQYDAAGRLLSRTEQSRQQ